MEVVTTPHLLQKNGKVHSRILSLDTTNEGGLQQQLLEAKVDDKVSWLPMFSSSLDFVKHKIEWKVIVILRS